MSNEWHGIGWRQGFILGSGLAWQIAAGWGTSGTPHHVGIAVVVCVAAWSTARWVERKEREKEKSE